MEQETKNKTLELGTEDREHGTKDRDGDRWNWSWDGNARCGFNNSL